MLKLRPATPEDTPLILQYIRELAEYERDPNAAVATEADILRHAFSEHPLIHVVLAEWEAHCATRNSSFPAVDPAVPPCVCENPWLAPVAEIKLPASIFRAVTTPANGAFTF